MVALLLPRSIVARTALPLTPRVRHVEGYAVKGTQTVLRQTRPLEKKNGA
jgi:hypothetical protein